MRAQKMLVLGLVSVLIVGGVGVALGSSRGTELARDDTEDLNDLFAGGSGTESDPYEISNVKQLQDMDEDLSAHYELVNDIDASATKEWNDGKGFAPLGTANKSFTGTLDGQGYRVNGLYIDRSSSECVGLFGYISGNASVKKLGIIDADVDGGNYVGALGGENHGIVEKSYAVGDVNGKNMTAGLIGENWGEVNNSHATGNVIGGDKVGGLVATNYGEIKNSYATGDLSGEDSIGGLMGRNYGIVNNSYATGNVNGNGGVGGLVGNNYLMVNNSYATGNVIGNHDVGGLVGWNYYGEVYSSFWDLNTTEQSSSAGGTGKTTAEMKDIDTFTDTSIEGLDDAWDFVGKPNDDAGYKDIWKIDENGTINNGYPYLTWSQDEKDTNPPTAVANADKTTVSIGKDISFDASGSSDNVGIISYSWEFDDGSTGSGETTTHSYTSAGDYTVTLTVTDSAGNSAEKTIQITVEEEGQDTESPTADAGEDKTVEVGKEFTLDASDSSDNEGIASYEWEFGNGETKSGEQVNYTYESIGNYTVTLTIEDAAGNTDTDTIQITVEESDDNGGGIPGFTRIALIVSMSLVAIYNCREKITQKFLSFF